VRHDETLADRDELEIIRTYKTIVRGIIQYFCLANNLWTGFNPRVMSNESGSGPIRNPITQTQIF
ncbi:MAG: hypothetical protein Q8874_02760, partial [Sweet potato little leaf phytoplasma]|nr:hypothetical protein [Sweet potato little leaf phytoplasma]